MKRTTLGCLVLACCLLLGACAQPKEEALPRACGEVADAIEGGQTFEEMTVLSENQIIKYLDLDASLLADMAMRIDASRATAEMIVVLTAKEAEALEQVQNALATYRDTMQEQYRDYRPDEVPKLEAAILKTKGMQTVLIVSPDAAAAEESLEEAWKQEA